MPFDDILSRITTGLADTAYAELTSFFASVGHTPSDQQWDAIRDLLDHLERAANGALPTALYVSAIPAGTGKSQSLAAFARALMASPDHAGSGMLILVNRIAEAADMAMALQDYRHKMCIYTSDPPTNALGAHDTANDAQVCVATQAALKATLKGLQDAPFAAATRFQFRGARRAVICWDEAFSFNRPVTLDADNVGGLARAMRRQSDEAANTLKRWTSDLDTHPGGLCSVPDFEGRGVDFRRLEDDVGDQDTLVAQVKALAVVSGGEGYVTRQGSASVMITHYPEIPRSLMPVMVTDASARVNPSYAQMQQNVPLVWLKHALKTYRNMTIRLVPTAASRSVYRDPKTFRGRDLIDMAVRYIETVPPEEGVLIIGYKGRFTIRGIDPTTIKDEKDATIRVAIESRLKPEDRSRVHFLAYGQHTATNAFKNCTRVLLMGLNFLPQAAGLAASGAALDLDLISQLPISGSGQGDAVGDADGRDPTSPAERQCASERWRRLWPNGSGDPPDQTDRVVEAGLPPDVPRGAPRRRRDPNAPEAAEGPPEGPCRNHRPPVRGRGDRTQQSQLVRRTGDGPAELRQAGQAA